MIHHVVRTPCIYLSRATANTERAQSRQALLASCGRGRIGNDGGADALGGHIAWIRGGATRRTAQSCYPAAVRRESA